MGGIKFMVKSVFEPTQSDAWPCAINRIITLPPKQYRSIAFLRLFWHKPWQNFQGLCDASFIMTAYISTCVHRFPMFEKN